MIRELDIPRDELVETLEAPGKVSGFVSPAEDYAQKRLHIAQRIDRLSIDYVFAYADFTPEVNRKQA